MHGGTLPRAVLAILIWAAAIACGGSPSPDAEPPTPASTAMATLTAVPPEAPADSLAGDKAALLEMRDELAGAGALNWDAGLPIENWDGVSITGSPPRVTALVLAGRRLSGAIPPTLWRLAALTSLDLSGNQLSGAIPPELGRLGSLAWLDLSNNQLGGVIPPELGRLADLGSLTSLDLSGNRLEGAVPRELERLAGLDFSGNRLAQRAIALVPAFPGLPALEEPVGLIEVPEHDLFLIVLQEGRVLAVPRDGPWSAPRTVHDQRDATARHIHPEEAGLLAVATDPDFARNGYVYAWYTYSPQPDAHTARLVRFGTTGSGETFAFDAASELLILEVAPIGGGHNGGALLFGPDGMLWLGIGDVGVGAHRGSFPGTVVRIDVRGATADAPYAIPPDNPYREDPRPEVWAYGLRNPWRMSFDRETGLLWAADVGEGRREEINIVRAGENYGWGRLEGSLCRSPMENCDRTGLVPPIHEYDHDDGCAIVGGYVYRGAALPALRGWYLFTDYCHSRIRAIPPEGAAGGEAAEPLFLWDRGPDFIVSFAEDAAGELYVVSREGARIYRVIADPAASR